MEQAFKELHRAALTLSTKMLAQLPQPDLDALDRATKQGGIVLMQLGPLPDCQRVDLVMREREGTTHVITSIGASHE